MPYSATITFPVSLGKRGRFDVRDFDAMGDGETDDAPAVQAAINAASHFEGPGGAPNSGGEVYIPPGVYLLGAPLTLGSVRLRGCHGGLYASSTLRWKKNVGESSDGTPLGEGGCLIVRSGVSSPTGPGDDAVIERLYLTQEAGGDPLKLCHGIKVLGKCEIRDVWIEAFQGDGVHIVGDMAGGSNANSWRLSGRVTLARNGRYGIISHGGDSSAGTSAASLVVVANGSHGVYDASIFGSTWPGSIDAEGNGIYRHPVVGQWFHSDINFSAFEWALGRVVTTGELVLPPVAARTGWQYRARNAGTLGPLPALPTTHGAHVLCGDVTLECWMEEGAGVYCRSVRSTFGHIYYELDQNRAKLAGAKVLGANDGLVPEHDAEPAWGWSAGRLMPHTVYTREYVGGGEFVYPVRIDLGANSADPYAALRLVASEVPDDPARGWNQDKSSLSLRWRPDWKRWQLRCDQGSYNQWTVMTIAGARDLPQPGAMCPGSIWLGGMLGIERRLTYLPPSPAGFPEFSPWTMFAQGRWPVGSIIFSTTGSPLLWRCIAPFGYPQGVTGDGLSGETWSPNLDVSPGTVIRFGTIALCCEVFGRTGGSQPMFTDTPGAIFPDNTTAWRHCGSTVVADCWEPVIP